jgi:hypothetical protein
MQSRQFQERRLSRLGHLSHHCRNGAPRGSKTAGSRDILKRAYTLGAVPSRLNPWISGRPTQKQMARGLSQRFLMSCAMVVWFACNRAANCVTIEALNI